MHRFTLLLTGIKPVHSITTRCFTKQAKPIIAPTVTKYEQLINAVSNSQFNYLSSHENKDWATVYKHPLMMRAISIGDAEMVKSIDKHYGINDIGSIMSNIGMSDNVKIWEHFRREHYSDYKKNIHLLLEAACYAKNYGLIEHMLTLDCPIYWWVYKLIQIADKHGDTKMIEIIEPRLSEVIYRRSRQWNKPFYFALSEMDKEIYQIVTPEDIEKMVNFDGKTLLKVKIPWDNPDFDWTCQNGVTTVNKIIIDSHIDIHPSSFRNVGLKMNDAVFDKLYRKSTEQPNTEKVSSEKITYKDVLFWTAMIPVAVICVAITIALAIFSFQLGYCIVLLISHYLGL
jgi:hypothetical protein